MRAFKANHLRPAFSLSEVIVSITILASTIVAIANLTASNLKANSENLLRLQAHLLATEGLELVRNQRDSLWIQNKAITEEALKNTASLNGKLEFTPDRGFQTGSNGTFERTVNIEHKENHFIVTSKVEFTKDKAIELTTYLSNWKHAQN